MAARCYVRTKLKDTNERTTETKLFPKNTNLCNHQTTMCIVCYEEWAADYDIVFATEPAREFEALVKVMEG